MKIAIIGAGVMGMMTAYYLSKIADIQIDVFDSEQDIMNAEQSGDHTRIFRTAYSQPLYRAMATQSIALWGAISRDFGVQIVYPVPCLLLGSQLNQSIPCSSAVTVFDPSAEDAHRAELFTLNESTLVDRSAAILDVDMLRLQLQQLRENSRISFHMMARVTGAGNGFVTTSSRAYGRYDAVLLSCGAYADKLLPMTLPVKSSARQILYIKPRAVNFTDHTGLLFADMDSGFFGIPDFHNYGIKIGNHHAVTGDDFTQQLQLFLERYLPYLQSHEVLRKVSCHYDMTPDDDFIIDEVSDSTYLLTGFSGHGFKFAPLIGKHMASRMTGGAGLFDSGSFTASDRAVVH